MLKTGATLALGSLCRSAWADPDPALALKEISSKSGLRVSVYPDGSYQIAAAAYGWVFGGAVGHPVVNATVLDGTDSVGDWHEIGFDYDTARHSAIRIYEDQTVVLFSTTFVQDGPNIDPFPRLATFPQGLATFSYTTLWNYEFGLSGTRSPWLFYDGQGNALLLSPADNFMTASTRLASDGAVEPGIDGRIATLPAGFTRRTILALGPGINQVFELWGQALTNWSGKARPANDALTLLNKLSYWTDATTAYYYRPSDPAQIAPNLVQVRATFDKLSLPISSMELDSWHYPKGSPPAWNQNTAGLASYQADPAIFPKGLKSFQTSLGIPLIAHSRWIDPNSDLRNKYKVSGNVSIDPKYWLDYGQYLASNGVEVLEQDWLSGPANTDFSLTAPDAFLDNMAAGMQAAGLNIVYCMPTWAHILQSTKYSNVVVARVAHDGLTRNNWDELLFNSRIAGAVGLWPFTDAYTSAKPRDLLLSLLTAGPVGSGENFATVDAASLRQVVRHDGVIVKPDVPIYPIDATWIARSQDQSAPMIASTYTDHSGLRTAYVLAYSRVQGALYPIAFSPQSLGISGHAYVYDFFAKSGSVVPAGSQFVQSVDYNGSYFLVAPIGPSGIAFLGDAGKYVSTGKKRIEQISDNGKMRAVVRFAAGETHAELHLYAATHPTATAESGKAGSPMVMGHGLYRVTVTPDASGVAVIRFATATPSPLA